MRALVIDNHTIHGEHGTELQDLVVSLGYVHCDVLKREHMPDVRTDKYDLLVLSGTSGQGAFPVMGHEDELRSEIELVQSWKGPLIGICYGCQILARAYGAILEPLSAPVEKQIIRIQYASHELLDVGTQTSVGVYASHKNRIATIPNEFEVLAESEYGPEIIVHKSLPHVGVMFHPEHVVEGNHGPELLRAVFTSIMSR